MQNKVIIIFFIITVIISSFTSCKTVTRLSHENLYYLYDKTDYQFNPEYKIFHHSKDSGTLFFRISSDELYYTQDSEEEPFAAHYKIRYRLFDSYRDNVVTDSLTTYFSDARFYKSGKNISDSIVLALPDGENHVMYLTMTDINRQTHSTNIITINKTGGGNIQYYKVYSVDDNKKDLMFSPMIKESGDYVLQYKDNISQTSYIDVYSAPQPAALPPFADDPQHLYEMSPDTTFQIYFENGVAELFVNTTGLYHVRHDDEATAGASLFYFHEGFPNIEDDKHKLYPLRYLTSSEEFEALISYPDPADAVDIFWTTMAGTHHRGSVTVDRFYDNVQKANKYFTTWKQGWKTDRGMIYSVFGPPHHVTKDNQSEKWTYHGSWRIQQTEFHFQKTDAPLGKKCYVLERKSDYRNVWFQIVENIRR